MKLFLLILLITIASSNDKAYQTPTSIPSVDQDRFKGLWYEIARTYNSFEKDCLNPKVEYTLVKENAYKVRNSCQNKNNIEDMIVFNGKAAISFDDNASTMDITYFWILTKKYLVINIDSEYKSAIIADETMKNVWIMNREPIMSQSKLKEKTDFLSMYMDSTKLIFSSHTKGSKNKN
jgi:apolipoprotein D and lipocalin family protein